MRPTNERFVIAEPGITFTVDIVMFDEDIAKQHWEHAPKHRGGVTVQWRDPHGGETYHYTPRDMSLAELARHYAANGHENPSAAAYKALQAELERDMSANAYGFNYTARIAGQVIVHDETCGYGFDWSYEDKESLLDFGRRLFCEEAIGECRSTVLERVRSLLSNIEYLRQVAALDEG